MPASYIITPDKQFLIMTLTFDRKRLESEGLHGGRDGVLRAADGYVTHGLDMWERKLERGSPFEESPIEKSFRRLIDRVPSQNEVDSMLIRLKCETCETEHNFESVNWINLRRLYTFAKNLHSKVTCKGVLREKLILKDETGECFTEDWLTP